MYGRAAPGTCLVARRYRMPAPWRHISDLLRGFYLLAGIRTLGEPVYAFSLNPKPMRSSKAKTTSKAMNWLRRRVARRLQVLDRPVAFVVAAEETTDTHRLHFHGVVAVDDNEVDLARKALRLAGGEFEKVRQHQAHTTPDPDIGWMQYSGKEFFRTTPKMREILGDSRRAVQFGGNALSATQDVVAAARADSRARPLVPCQSRQDDFDDRHGRHRSAGSPLRRGLPPQNSTWGSFWNTGTMFRIEALTPPE